MKNFKFTGVNIAAAILVIAFFFPWVSAMGNLSMSGFSITTTGISPGMLSMAVNGFSRLFMILVALVPLSGAVILYQNITGNMQFNKYHSPAHIVPSVILIAGMLMLYFKMKPSVPDALDGYSMVGLSKMQSMAPGLFDILGTGTYISIAASLYLLLVNMGKIKDKEYYTASKQVNAGTQSDNGSTAG